MKLFMAVLAGMAEALSLCGRDIRLIAFIVDPEDPGSWRRTRRAPPTKAAHAALPVAL
jgi:hypothetical protein